MGSPAYLYLLRKGQRDNPTKRHLELLARFFGMPVSYFFDDDEASARLAAEVVQVAALGDEHVRQLAVCAAGHVALEPCRSEQPGRDLACSGGPARVKPRSCRRRRPPPSSGRVRG